DAPLAASTPETADHTTTLAAFDPPPAPPTFQTAAPRGDEIDGGTSHTFFGHGADIADDWLQMPAVPAEPPSAGIAMPAFAPPRPPRLRSISLRGGLGEFAITPGVWDVGRQPSCRLFINDRQVSRHHGTLTVT